MFFLENCKGKRNNIRSSPHLNYKLEFNKQWSRTCKTPGFVPLAITTTDIQYDINDLLFKLNRSQPLWVAGTNMRWVWITGLFVSNIHL